MWEKLGISVSVIGIGLTMSLFALSELGKVLHTLLWSYWSVGVIMMIVGGYIGLNLLKKKYEEGSAHTPKINLHIPGTDISRTQIIANTITGLLTGIIASIIAVHLLQTGPNLSIVTQDLDDDTLSLTVTNLGDRTIQNGSIEVFSEPADFHREENINNLATGSMYSIKFPLESRKSEDEMWLHNYTVYNLSKVNETCQGLNPGENTSISTGQNSIESSVYYVDVIKDLPTNITVTLNYEDGSKTNTIPYRPNSDIDGYPERMDFRRVRDKEKIEIAQEKKCMISGMDIGGFKHDRNIREYYKNDEWGWTTSSSHASMYHSLID